MEPFVYIFATSTFLLCTFRNSPSFRSIFELRCYATCQQSPTKPLIENKFANHETRFGLLLALPSWVQSNVRSLSSSNPPKLNIILGEHRETVKCKTLMRLLCCDLLRAMAPAEGEEKWSCWPFPSARQSTCKRTQKKHIRHCLIAMDNFHRNLLTLIFSQKVFFAFQTSTQWISIARNLFRVLPSKTKNDNEKEKTEK